MCETSVTKISKQIRLAALVLLLFLASCALPQQDLRQPPQYTEVPNRPGYARLNSFFAMKDSRAPAVRMDIDEVSVLDGHYWLPLTSQPLTIDSEELADAQMFLGAIVLPPGTYSSIRFSFTSIQIGDESGAWREINEFPATVEISLAEKIHLAADESAALFVLWDVERSLTRGGGFEPRLQVTAATRQLPLDLLYVSCPDIDTIFVVRADENRVVDAFGITGGPTWINAVQTGGDGFLYVLAAQDRLVKVVDLSTFRTVDFFPAPLNDAPTFMQVDAAGRVAFLLDEKSGYVSRMDLRSGYIEARTYLGFQPHFAIYIEEKNLLAVSLALSQKVQLLDADTLENRGELSTGGRPQGLLFANDILYVAEQGDDTVAIFNLDSRRSLGRIAVNQGPMRIVDTDNQIYVSHRVASSVAALTPGQLSVFREIPNLGRTTEMTYDPTFRRLYVVDERAGELAVIDVNANLLIGRVEFGARPVGLAVLP
ncbi:MAG: hypothetical protein R6V21_00795 [Pelovirga sp.]